MLVTRESTAIWAKMSDDLLSVLAEQLLGHRAQLLHLIGDGVRVVRELRMGLADLVRAHLALHAVAEVVEQDADRADWIGEPDLAEPGELLADRLHHAEGDERAHDVVGALEDREDADVAQDLLVGLVAHVAGPAL
jgi:hypothetical protein